MKSGRKASVIRCEVCTKVANSRYLEESPGYHTSGLWKFQSWSEFWFFALIRYSIQRVSVDWYWMKGNTWMGSYKFPLAKSKAVRRPGRPAAMEATPAATRIRTPNRKRRVIQNGYTTCCLGQHQRGESTGSRQTMWLTGRHREQNAASVIGTSKLLVSNCLSGPLTLQAKVYGDGTIYFWSCPVPTPPVYRRTRALSEHWDINRNTSCIRICALWPVLVQHK